MIGVGLPECLILALVFSLLLSETHGVTMRRLHRAKNDSRRKQLAIERLDHLSLVRTKALRSIVSRVRLLALVLLAAAFFVALCLPA